VELPSSGSEKGKCHPAQALRMLAGGNDANRAAIVAAGAIPLLVELLRDGSGDGKGLAAETLGMLPGGIVDIASAVAVAGAIPLLMGLLSGGSDESKIYAAKALAKIPWTTREQTSRSVTPQTQQPSCGRAQSPRYNIVGSELELTSYYA
jgi:vacuolar protein 8